jgi:hypothetical protein
MARDDPSGGPHRPRVRFLFRVWLLLLPLWMALAFIWRLTFRTEGGVVPAAESAGRTGLGLLLPWLIGVLIWVWLIYWRVPGRVPLTVRRWRGHGLAWWVAAVLLLAFFAIGMVSCIYAMAQYG